MNTYGQGRNNSVTSDTSKATTFRAGFSSATFVRNDTTKIADRSTIPPPKARGPPMALSEVGMVIELPDPRGNISHAYWSTYPEGTENRDHHVANKERLAFIRRRLPIEREQVYKMFDAAGLAVCILPKNEAIARESILLYVPNTINGANFAGAIFNAPEMRTLMNRKNLPAMHWGERNSNEALTIPAPGAAYEELFQKKTLRAIINPDITKGLPDFKARKAQALSFLDGPDSEQWASVPGLQVGYSESATSNRGYLNLTLWRSGALTNLANIKDWAWIVGEAVIKQVGPLPLRKYLVDLLDNRLAMVKCTCPGAACIANGACIAKQNNAALTLLCSHGAKWDSEDRAIVAEMLDIATDRGKALAVTYEGTSMRFVAEVEDNLQIILEERAGADGVHRNLLHRLNARRLSSKRFILIVPHDPDPMFCNGCGPGDHTGDNCLGKLLGPYPAIRKPSPPTTAPKSKTGRGKNGRGRGGGGTASGRSTIPAAQTLCDGPNRSYLGVCERGDACQFLHDANHSRVGDTWATFLTSAGVVTYSDAYRKFMARNGQTMVPNETRAPTTEQQSG